MEFSGLKNPSAKLPPDETTVSPSVRHCAVLILSLVVETAASCSKEKHNRSKVNLSINSFILVALCYCNAGTMKGLIDKQADAKTQAHTTCKIAVYCSSQTLSKYLFSPSILKLT